MRELVHRTLEPEPSELPRLTGARPEAGTPKQPLGLRLSELPSPDGNTRHETDIGSDRAILNPRSESDLWRGGYALFFFAWRFSFSVFWAGFFAMLFFEFLSFVAMVTSSRSSLPWIPPRLTFHLRRPSNLPRSAG
jgi:hypothetical protein